MPFGGTIDTKFSPHLAINPSLLLPLFHRRWCPAGPPAQLHSVLRGGTSPRIAALAHKAFHDYRRVVASVRFATDTAGPFASKQTNECDLLRFQARMCNTLAFRAVARTATHRYRVHRPAPWPRARTGAHTATLPWRGGRGAGKGVLPPPPQRRWPAGVVQCLRAGPSHRRAAHLRAADTAHGRADGIDHRATRRL